MNALKNKLYEHCRAALQKRIMTSMEAIRMAQASANEETKSSAGDKYETGRAMAQLEIEKNMQQLHEAQREMKILESISPDASSMKVALGSLVATDQGNYFVAVSVGVINVEGKSYGVVSAQSPIGKMLMGKSKGDTYMFNNKLYTVQSVQ